MGLPLRGPKVKSKHLKLLNLCKICKCPLHPPAPPIEHASVQLYDYNNNKYYIVTVQILFNYVILFFIFFNLLLIYVQLHLPSHLTYSSPSKNSNNDTDSKGLHRYQLAMCYS